MPMKILIPTPLRPYADRKESVQFDARTVGEALDLLTGRYAELRKHLYADDGRLRSFINVYVNDEDIRFLQKEQTPVKEGDIISIIPSIAGGMQRWPEPGPAL
ncbi:MAG: MoaD/ThiS family protein [Acidobacteria bacterium]|nr:MoaD/ThiS family protein [Acidobacteriota bacterium]MBI3661850.1 MoaD/ThiS family protein [Acidobacteriota bacterium]